MRLVSIVLPVDQRNLVGSTVHGKSIHVIDKAEFNRLYGSQKKVKRFEGVVVNVDQTITNQSRKKLYFIADNKNPDGSFKRYRIYIRSVVAVPVLVLVPVNLPDTAPMLTVTTTTIFPANTSISDPSNHSTPVDSTTFDPTPAPTITTTTVAPALLPTTTTIPANCNTIVSPAPDPTITTTVPSNPPTYVVPEPDTTTTTCVYANPQTQNSPVPDPTPPPKKPLYLT